MDDQEKPFGRIAVTFSVEGSGFAAIDVERTVTLAVLDETLEATRADLAVQLEHEYGLIRRLSGLLLRLAEWRRERGADCEALAEQKIRMRIEIEADATQLQVEFVGEYDAPEAVAMVHPVRFDITRAVPPASEVLARLDEELQTLLRVLSFQLPSVAGLDGRETLRVPTPFLKSKAVEPGEPGSGEFPLEARPATAEEAKKFIGGYLNKFRFPFELVDGELTYSILPRVEVRGDSIQLIVTLLIPASERSTLAKLGSKTVTVPLDEIYVHGEELSRRTQEGILGLFQGLCRALAREQGLRGEVDISRPH